MQPVVVDKSEYEKRIAPPLVIYHANCMDGFTSAWAYWLKYPDAEFFAATHGEPPPDVRGRRVIILDFSYKRPVLLNMLESSDIITIIDHHRSTQAELDGLVHPKLEVDFNMQKSGARLAWEHFHSSFEIPRFVRMVEDRDLWRFALPGTREAAAAVFSYPYDFNVWNKLSDRCEDIEEFHLLIQEGEAIERKHHKDIGELVTACRTRLVIGGFDVPAANLPYTFASDAGHLLLADGAPFAATYYDTREHRIYSLRSAEDGVDVSIIASAYGGGGHKHAAGFRLKHGASL